VWWEASRFLLAARPMRSLFVFPYLGVDVVVRPEYGQAGALRVTRDLSGGEERGRRVWAVVSAKERKQEARAAAHRRPAISFAGRASLRATSHPLSAHFPPYLVPDALVAALHPVPAGGPAGSLDDQVGGACLRERERERERGVVA
jgi:hypothetical protein